MRNVIVIDTETCPIRHMDDVKAWNMLAYDAGYHVANRKGEVLKKRSFIIKEIFFGQAKRMRSAYYAHKIPQYLEDLAAGKRVLVSFAEFKEILYKDIEEYNVKDIYAHNMPFDYTVLAKTEAFLENRWELHNFFPSSCVINDTAKMVRSLIFKMPSFVRFVDKYGLRTPTGRLPYNAEAVYRFISKNPDFVESHTGLEDTEIEMAIMVYCFRQHKHLERIYQPKF